MSRTFCEPIGLIDATNSSPGTNSTHLDFAEQSFRFLEAMMTEFLSTMKDLMSMMVSQYHPQNDERRANHHTEELTAENKSLRKKIDGFEERLHCSDGLNCTNWRKRSACLFRVFIHCLNGLSPV
jgi:FtsZ-binding cell division protein ZapB